MRHPLLPLLAVPFALSGCLSLSPELPPIVVAARTGNLNRIEQLAAAGADLNVHAGVHRWTPLLHAIHKNQPGSVRLLLDHGARVNEPGGGGLTPLIMAAGYGYAGIAAMLLEAGADPELQTRDGTTALVAAVGGVPDIDRFTVGRCQTDTVRVLLHAAPNLRIPRGLEGDSALAIARLAGCTGVLKLVRKSR
jgi:hypothetical protein